MLLSDCGLSWWMFSVERGVLGFSLTSMNGSANKLSFY